MSKPKILSKFLILCSVLIFLSCLVLPTTPLHAAAPPHLQIVDMKIDGQQEVKLKAGQTANLEFFFKNVNAGGPAQNISFSFKSAKDEIIPIGVGTHFIDQIPAWITKSWVLPIRVLASCEPGMHKITISMQYLDDSGASISEEQDLYLEVDQSSRLEYDNLIYSKRLTQGEVGKFELNVMNMGQSLINNALLKADIPGLADGNSHLLGKVEPGANNQGVLSVMVADTVEPGKYKGKIILSYEDVMKSTFQKEFPVEIEVEKRQEYKAPEDNIDYPKLIKQFKIGLGIVGGISLILLILVIVQQNKIRKLKDAEAARL